MSDIVKRSPEWYYYDKFGTSFGFVKTTERTPPTGYTVNDMIVRGIYTHCHSLRDLGLHPHSKPRIISPDIQSDPQEVAGRDGLLDDAEEMDGTVHFFNREGVFEFVNIDGRETWDASERRLKKLHGRKVQIVVDEDPTGYYYGRLHVDEPEYDSEGGKAFYTVTADLEPFKYDFNTTIEPWLWDPFSFIDGVIRSYGNKTVSGTSKNPASITIYGSMIPTVPDIQVLSGSLSVKYTNMYGTQRTVPLTTGTTPGINLGKLYDLYLTDDSPKVLQFVGSGTINIAFRTGVI